MFEPFVSYPFLLFALLAGIFASITGGVVGTYIVIKRIVFIAGSIAHCVLGGMGLFLWLRRTYDLPFLDPLYGALLAAIASAFLMSWIHLKYRQREDTVIAAIWSTGMALGVILISQTPGSNVELMNFLFGNILWTSFQDLLWLIVLAIVVIVTTFRFHPILLALSFDEEQVALQGISVKKYYTMLLALVAVSVVVLIQVVGAILVITLLAIPSAVASNVTKRASSMILLSIGVGILCSYGGISISYITNWPTGATIALFAALLYLASLLFRAYKPSQIEQKELSSRKK